MSSANSVGINSNNGITAHISYINKPLQTNTMMPFATEGSNNRQINGHTTSSQKYKYKYNYANEQYSNQNHHTNNGYGNNPRSNIIRKQIAKGGEGGNTYSSVIGQTGQTGTSLGYPNQSRSYTNESAVNNILSDTKVGGKTRVPPGDNRNQMQSRANVHMISDGNSPDDNNHYSPSESTGLAPNIVGLGPTVAGNGSNSIIDASVQPNHSTNGCSSQGIAYNTFGHYDNIMVNFQDSNEHADGSSITNDRSDNGHDFVNTGNDYHHGWKNTMGGNSHKLNPNEHFQVSIKSANQGSYLPNNVPIDQPSNSVVTKISQHEIEQRFQDELKNFLDDDGFATEQFEATSHLKQGEIMESTTDSNYKNSHTIADGTNGKFTENKKYSSSSFDAINHQSNYAHQNQTIDQGPTVNNITTMTTNGFNNLKSIAPVCSVNESRNVEKSIRGTSEGSRGGSQSGISTNNSSEKLFVDSKDKDEANLNKVLNSAGIHVTLQALKAMKLSKAVTVGNISGRNKSMLQLHILCTMRERLVQQINENSNAQGDASGRAVNKSFRWLSNIDSAICYVNARIQTERDGAEEKAIQDVDSNLPIESLIDKTCVLVDLSSSAHNKLNADFHEPLVPVSNKGEISVSIDDQALADSDHPATITERFEFGPEVSKDSYFDDNLRNSEIGRKDSDCRSVDSINSGMDDKLTELQDSMDENGNFGEGLPYASLADVDIPQKLLKSKYFVRFGAKNYNKVPIGSSQTAEYESSAGSTQILANRNVMTLFRASDNSYYKGMPVDAIPKDIINSKYFMFPQEIDTSEELPAISEKEEVESVNMTEIDLGGDNRLEHDGTNDVLQNTGEDIVAIDVPEKMDEDDLSTTRAPIGTASSPKIATEKKISWHRKKNVFRPGDVIKKRDRSSSSTVAYQSRSNQPASGFVPGSRYPRTLLKIPTFQSESNSVSSNQVSSYQAKLSSMPRSVDEIQAAELTPSSTNTLSDQFISEAPPISCTNLETNSFHHDSSAACVEEIFTSELEEVFTSFEEITALKKRKRQSSSNQPNRDRRAKKLVFNRRSEKKKESVLNYDTSSSLASSTDSSPWEADLQTFQKESRAKQYLDMIATNSSVVQSKQNNGLMGMIDKKSLGNDTASTTPKEKLITDDMNRSTIESFIGAVAVDLPGFIQCLIHDINPKVLGMCSLFLSDDPPNMPATSAVISYLKRKRKFNDSVYLYLRNSNIPYTERDLIDDNNNDASKNSSTDHHHVNHREIYDNSNIKSISYIYDEKKFVNNYDNTEVDNSYCDHNDSEYFKPIDKEIDLFKLVEQNHNNILLKRNILMRDHYYDDKSDSEEDNKYDDEECSIDSQSYRRFGNSTIEHTTTVNTVNCYDQEFTDDQTPEVNVEDDSNSVELLAMVVDFLS